jgi:hypothetical protein
MAKEIALPVLHGDLLMVRLARAIAQDMLELGDILKANGVSDEVWKVIEQHPRFQKYLQEAILDWNAAENTPERVKIKAAAAVEEWLPEAFAQMHNSDAPLLHRNDLAKLMAKLGGMDNSRQGGEGVSLGERFQVTINLGADAKLSFDKQVPSKVTTIEHEEIIDAS